jgi:hypothetical protein
VIRSERRGGLLDDAEPTPWWHRPVPDGASLCHKPLPPGEDVSRALAAIFGALDELPALRCVPSRVVGGRIVTVFLPDMVDLRAGPAPTGDRCDDARRVREACLRSYDRFADADPVLRQALTRAGATPAAFPVAARYAAAREAFADLVGDPTDLPEPLPQKLLCGRSMLFCDPKPANFLVPTRERDQVGRAGAAEPIRVDLDLMYYECAISLQLVVALFAHPVALCDDDSRPHGMAEQVEAAYAAAGRYGVGTDEVDAMLLYHLVRNFTSAARQSEHAKARGLAPLLEWALTELPVAGATGVTVRRLRQWIAGHAG